MKQKKRYLLYNVLPEHIPKGAKVLFQNKQGYVVKADLRTALQIKCDCCLASGSIRKLKHPKLLNQRKTKL